jgi:hypothetical protein
VSPQLSAAYESALRSTEPVLVMRKIVSDELQRTGGDRELMLAELQELRAMARRDGLDEDPVLDLMDFVYGWSSPHMKIS